MRACVRVLQRRGTDLPGLESVPTPDAHAQRLRAAGYGAGATVRVACIRVCAALLRGRAAAAVTMLAAYAALPADERAAAERREFLDELEEWHLLMGHYVVALGATRGDFPAWAALSHAVGLS